MYKARLIFVINGQQGNLAWHHHFFPPSNSRLPNVVAHPSRSLLKLPRSSTSRLKRFSVVRLPNSSGNVFKCTLPSMVSSSSVSLKWPSSIGRSRRLLTWRQRDCSDWQSPSSSGTNFTVFSSTRNSRNRFSMPISFGISDSRLRPK